MSGDLRLVGEYVYRMKIDFRDRVPGEMRLNLEPETKPFPGLRLYETEATMGDLGSSSGTLSFSFGPTGSAEKPSEWSDMWERIGMLSWSPRPGRMFDGFRCSVQVDRACVTCIFSTNGNFLDTAYNVIKEFLLHFKIVTGDYDTWPSETRQILEEPRIEFRRYFVATGQALSFEGWVKKTLG